MLLPTPGRQQGGRVNRWHSPAPETSGRPEAREQQRCQGHSRLPHVLFLNTRDALAADVSVHITLARSLDRQMVHVSAATGSYQVGEASARAELAAIQDLHLFVLELGRPLSGQSRLKHLAALGQNARGIASLFRLARWGRRQHIDVVHVTDRPRDALFGLLLARLTGGRCLIHAHTNYYRHNAASIRDWVLRRADAVVGVSEFSANTYVEAAAASPRRVFAVHNAVDSAMFRPQVPAVDRLAMRRRLGVTRDGPVIGCVARLNRWKDQATLVEALELVRREAPGAQLVLAGFTADAAPDGSGDYRDYLERRIEALGLGGAVKFAGFLPHRDMPAFYAALDVVAHPSVEEPFGLAVVEAMASGRPIVAVQSGGIPEIVRAGLDGLLVPPRDAAAMAGALVRVLGDPALAARLATSGRDRVSTVFTPERQAAAMVQVYRQVIAAGAWKSDEPVASERLERAEPAPKVL